MSKYLEHFGINKDAFTPQLIVMITIKVFYGKKFTQTKRTTLIETYSGKTKVNSKKFRKN